MDKLKDFENLPDPATKADLLERMAATYETAESLIASHTETTLSTPLHDGGWSIKDHLAHLTAWELGIVVLLQKGDRFGAMGIDENVTNIRDTDAINEVLSKLHQDRPFATVLSQFRQTRQDLLNELAPLSDEDLQKPYKFYQHQAEGEYVGNPIMGWLAGDTYDHYAEHLLEIGRLLQNP